MLPTGVALTPKPSSLSSHHTVSRAGILSELSQRFVMLTLGMPSPEIRM